MNLINTFILWTWLLGSSLVMPTTLPAGGAQKSIILHSVKNSGSPLIALKGFNLLSSAYVGSSVLTIVKAGTPVNILKVWDNDESGKWLLVNVLSQYSHQSFYRRGWVNIHSS